MPRKNLMKSFDKLCTGFGFMLLSIFLWPILFSLVQIIHIESIDFQFFYKNIFYVIGQSFLSASFSVFIGLLMALSYVKKAAHVKKTLYWGLLPQALPTVLIVYAYFKIFSFFGIYPQSYFHVIVVHVLINMGLVSFLIFPHVQDEIEKKLHLMISLKISINKFFQLIVLGELAPTVFYIWILIFSFSLTSFSVPLLLSGSVPSSFDYLIYLKGYVEGDWASAAFIGILEFVFLGCLFFLRTEKLSTSARNTNFIILRDPKSIFYLFNLLPLMLILISLFHIGEGNSLEAFKALSFDFREIIINTFFLSSWTFLFYTLIFWSQLYILKFESVRKFHQFFWPLSPILLSFVILSISLYFLDSVAIKVAFSGLAIASFVFPIVFKFWILPEYSTLINFHKKSQILSVSYPRFFDQVIGPYFYSAFQTSLAYVILFAIGDFTISGILLSDLKTIGISMRTYIQSYQLIEAQLLAICLIILAFILIFFIGGGLGDKNKKF